MSGSGENNKKKNSPKPLNLMLLIHYLKHYYILIKHFTYTFHIVVVINLKKKTKKKTEVIILGKQVFICAVFSSPHSPKEHMAFVHGGM